MDTRAAIRLALSLAATYQAEGRTLGKDAQIEIECEIERLADGGTAMRERDAALRDAHQVCRYSVSLLDGMVRKFEARQWPSWCWFAVPPTDAGPLAIALFTASRCQMALDGTPGLPNERRLRQIVQSSHSDFTPDREY